MRAIGPKCSPKFEWKNLKENTMKQRFLKSSLVAAGLLIMSFTANAAESNYKFKVHNTSGQTIKGILVSETGKEYGHFDIGSGIKAGETADLVWDASTDSEGCRQYFKAVFADGSESEATKFDFCESELTIEF